jgi:hypothetical protein
MAPTMPKVITTLDFTEDGYPGFSCEAWVSAPISKTDTLFKTEDEDAMRGLLLELLPSWDFGDEKGKAIPHTKAGFDKLPRLLVVAMIKRYQLAMSGLPQSFATASPSSSGSGTPKTPRSRR